MPQKSYNMVYQQEMPIYHPTDEQRFSSSLEKPVLVDTSDKRDLPGSAIPSRFDYLDEFKSQTSSSKGSRQEPSKREQRQQNSKRDSSSRGGQLTTKVFPFLDALISIEIDPYQALEDAFKKWDTSFNSFSPSGEKRHPPSPSVFKPSYIRQEFQTKRSPHAWKTDPKIPAILAFGPMRHFLNKVVEILFKYQNNTIEAKA